MEHKVTSDSTQCEKNNVNERSVILMLDETGMSRAQTHRAVQQNSVRFLWTDSVTA